MKRRPPSEDDQVPARLTRFRADEWGGGPQAAQRWYDAREQWTAEGNEVPPMDLTDPPPDVPWHLELT